MRESIATAANSATITRAGALRQTGRTALGVAVFGIGALAAPVRIGAASMVKGAYLKAGFTCEGALFIAQQKGFFQAEGLELATTGIPSPAEIQAEMLKDNIDVAQDPAWALVPRLLGKDVPFGDVVATAGLQRGSACICVAADSTIRSAADLRGQTVAAAPRWQFMFGPQLSAAGLDPMKDIDWKPGLAPGAVAEALRSKTVAAAQVHQPYAAALVSSGVGRMLLMQNKPPLQNDYCCSVIMPRKLVNEDRSKAAKITRALIRAATFMRDHPAESAQLEMDSHYITQSAADNLSGMAELDFLPTVDVARANTLDVLGRFKRLGFLDASTDENALLAKLFVPVT